MSIRLLYIGLIVTIHLSAICCSDSHRGRARAAGEPLSSESLIALQPYGSIRKDVLDTVAAAITRVYSAKVMILPSRMLPRQAYYKPRNRYKADTLLRYLDDSIDGSYTKVLGITDRDISTTKGSVKDWGILGLGAMSGRPCVISTHRMNRAGVSRGVFFHRLISVTIHELGHTFGLPHCPNEGCVMEDAKGSVATVDDEGDFCSACAKRLRDDGVLR